MNDPKIVKKSEANKLVVDLPPAGYKRDEELARRQGALDEYADNLSAEGGVVDLKSLPEDREIRDLLDKDMLEVSHKQSDYEYVWQYAPPYGDSMSRQEVMRKKNFGWEIVSGSMPECKELDTGSGTRRLGDCILMRTTKAQFAKIEAYQAEKRRKQQGTVQAEFDAASNPSKGVFGQTTTSTRGQKLIAAGSRKSVAEAMALRSLTGRLKGGTIPGLKAGKGR